MQVDSGFSWLTLHLLSSVKPKCEESLSNVAFNCDLRHYITDPTGSGISPTELRCLGLNGGAVQVDPRFS